MNTPLFPLDKRKFYPYSKYYYFEPDTSHMITYQHNSFGARSEEYNPDAEFRFITFGASIIFATGLDQELNFCSKLKKMFSVTLNLPESKINGLNLGFGGHSNDSLSRMILTYANSFKPNLIVCNLTALSRKEIIYDNSIGTIGDWFLKNPYTRTNKAVGFFDYYDESQGILCILKNILLIQQHCRLKGIDCLFTNADWLPEDVWSDSRYTCYTGNIEKKYLISSDPFPHLFDLAGDDRHPGEISNEVFAYNVIQYLMTNKADFGFFKSIDFLADALKGSRAEKYAEISNYKLTEHRDNAELQREAIASFPDDYRLYYRLAVMLCNSGKTAEAENILKEGIEKTSHWALSLKLARLYKEQNKNPELIDTMNTVISNPPQEDKFYFSLCLFALDLNDYDSAYNAVNKAIELNSAVSEYYKFKSHIELKGQNPQLALDSIRTAITVNKYDYELYLRLSEIYSHTGSDAQTLAAINQAKEINPNSYEVYMHLSEYCRSKGDIPSAIENLQEALTIAPTLLVYWIRLANLYISAGEQDTALDALTTCIEEYIEHDSLYYECAKILLNMQRYPEALEAVDYAIGMNDSIKEYTELHDRISSYLNQ